MTREDLKIIFEIIDQEIEFYKSVRSEDELEDEKLYNDGLIAGMIHIKGRFRRLENNDREEER